MNQSQTIVTVITQDLEGVSLFSEERYSLENYNGMFISGRQEALNFRHRVSAPSYFSDWHVAGDPTLIIVLKGCLRIELRNGSFQDFHAGDMFIARDKTAIDQEFDKERHGHRARVMGEEHLQAVHVKLGLAN